VVGVETILLGGVGADLAVSMAVILGRVRSIDVREGGGNIEFCIDALSFNTSAGACGTCGRDGNAGACLWSAIMCVVDTPLTSP